MSGEIPDGQESNFSALFTAEPATKMSDSLTSMILHFAESAYTRGLNVPPSYNPFTPMLAWNTIYYTIYSTAVLLEDKPLLGPLPMRQNSCLQSLTAFGGTLFVGLIKIKIK